MTAIDLRNKARKVLAEQLNNPQASFDIQKATVALAVLNLLRLVDAKNNELE